MYLGLAGCGLEACNKRGFRVCRLRASSTSGFWTPMEEIPIPALPVPIADPIDANTRAAAAPPNPSAGAHGGQSSSGSRCDDVENEDAEIALATVTAANSKDDPWP